MKAGDVGRTAICCVLLGVLMACDAGSGGSGYSTGASGYRHDPLLDRNAERRAAVLAERFKLGQTDR